MCIVGRVDIGSGIILYNIVILFDQVAQDSTVVTRVGSLSGIRFYGGFNRKDW